MVQRRKKNRTHKEIEAPDLEKIPKSFVLQIGQCTRSTQQLVRDFRKVMEPHTATKLKERKRNTLKDFVQIAGQMGVSHFVMMKDTPTGINLRLARSPRGPTLTFKVQAFSNTKDVLHSQQKPKLSPFDFHCAPLLVLNNFQGKENKFKLMTSMLQNMFPSINVQTMKLADARRVALFNYVPEEDIVQFRHYSISVKHVGISKSVKRILQVDIPNLQDMQDISDYVLREAVASESDCEEETKESTVTLGQNYVGRNNSQSEQRAIKLIELGPRMDLQLKKIQTGLGDGEVLYHQYIHKSAEDIKQQKKERELKMQQKALLRKQQEENVLRKKNIKEATSGKKRPHEGSDNEDQEDSECSDNESNDECVDFSGSDNEGSD